MYIFKQSARYLSYTYAGEREHVREVREHARLWDSPYQYSKCLTTTHTLTVTQALV